MGHIAIIGNGPAGISAAIYIARSGLRATVIGNGGGSLEKAEKVENYYGFEQPISGKELLRRGIEQARRLGAMLLHDEVVNLAYDGQQFVITTRQGEHAADSVILATGSSRTTPKIPGIERFEYKGISFCAVCDGFFYRGKDVAVLGCCDYAAHEAKELLPLARSVTLLTNGVPPIPNLPEGLGVDTRRIAELRGDDALQSVAFSDGDTLPISGLFIAQGVAGSADLAKKVGAETSGNRIVVDETMQSNIPGLFAAGDCTGGMMQIAKAVYEGARAGTEAVKELRAR